MYQVVDLACGQLTISMDLNIAIQLMAYEVVEAGDTFYIMRGINFGNEGATCIGQLDVDDNCLMSIRVYDCATGGEHRELEQVGKLLSVWDMGNPLDNLSVEAV